MATNKSDTALKVSLQKTYLLNATKDVWLEGDYSKSYYDFLILGKHPGYLKKRTLLQFQDIPSDCTNIISAKMYLWYWYSHKASWQSSEQVPFLNHTFNVHQIKKEWSETQATSTYRKSGIAWSQPYLALDGSDADANAIDSVFFPNPPPITNKWIEFNITEAAQNWKAGQPNYGVVIWSIRENENGRDVRFYSRERNINRPYIEMQCGSRSSSSASKHASPSHSLHPSLSSEVWQKPLTPTPFPSPSLTMSLHMQATQDVWLEGDYSKSNYDFLILAKHPDFLKKRSLLQFEDIPSGCTNVISAKMYLWYWYSHKASWLSNEQAPFLNHTFKVHQIKKEWSETQATSTHRKAGIQWSQPYLALDGTDADANAIDSVFFPNPPPTTNRWIEFDITKGAQNWKSGQPNYGVMIWSIRENENGRDVRFYSRERNINRPYIEIQCGSRSSSSASKHASSSDSFHPSLSSEVWQKSLIPTPFPSPSLIMSLHIQATQDVWLEGDYSKSNYDFLILAKHPDFLKKRSLLQFEDIPSDCTNVISAKMYLWYWYSHKASWLSNEQAPFLNHTFKVHQIKKEWSESQATSTYRKAGIQWSQPYLALDGTDADANAIDSVFFPNPPPTINRWIEFDLTEAARNWKAGQPNYGVVIWSIRENENGRDVRFYSRERSTNKPYLELKCGSRSSISSADLTYLSFPSLSSDLLQQTPSHSSELLLKTLTPTPDPSPFLVMSFQATKDVWLENDYSRSYYDFLILAKHPEYPKKRSLLQFEDIPSDCTNVISAKMYLWYWYSHKASWQSNEQAPYLNHTFNVHQIKKEWSETQATRTHRMSGIAWSQPYLALDGTDAYSNSLDSVFFPNPPPTTNRWIEFDITEAAQNWKAGEPNYGVVIWATNEDEDGRDVRFYSRERSTNRPYLKVHCS